MGNEISRAIWAIYENRKDLLGIKQKQIASIIGVTPGAVSHYVTGRTGLNEEKIIALCRALGIRWQDLDVEIDQQEASQDEQQILPLRRLIEQLRNTDTIIIEKAEDDIRFLGKVGKMIKQGQRQQEEQQQNPEEQIREQDVQDHEIQEADTEPIQAPATPEPEPPTTLSENVLPFPLTPPLSLPSTAPAEGFDHNIDDPQEPRWVTVPFFRKIVANSTPDMAEPEVGLWCEIMHSKKKASWYVLEVDGNSMETELHHGDLILMDRNKAPEQGQIVAAWIDGVGGTLKRFYLRGDQVDLIPDNLAEHSSITYPAEQVHIQGTCIEIVRRRLRNGTDASDRIIPTR